MTRIFDPKDRVIGLSGSALDVVMPMHLWFGPGGQIIRVGPTLAKIAGDQDLRGRDLFDVIHLRRPRAGKTLAQILSLQGARLSLTITGCENAQFRGVVVAMPAGAGGLINLSLGVSFAKTVEERGLTLKDFSPCDQTVDLLYLREANLAITRESRNLTERLQAAKLSAEKQAQTDVLTGLQNRRAMDEALKTMVDQPNPRFGLMHLDLDFFKEVNDTFGHAAGDHVLAHVADILRAEVRKTDIVARVGGDEFVLLFRDCDDPDLLDTIANRLIARLEVPTQFDGKACQISASAGSVLSSKYDNPTPDKLLNDADVALYTSKNRGRAQHTLFHDELMLPVPAAR